MVSPILDVASATDHDCDLHALRSQRTGFGQIPLRDVDTFEGVVIDPQTLHKYNYVHGDPVNGIDPTGQWATSTTELNVASSLSAKIGISIAATALLTRPALYNHLATVERQQLQAVATDLNTKIITTSDTEQPGSRVFLHGANLTEWSFSGFIDATIGDVGDFGIGYYTFPAEDSRSMRKVIERAQPWRGIPFIIVTAVDLPTWKEMSKWDLTVDTTSGQLYKEIVTAFRGEARDSFTTYDVVFGEVAKLRPVQDVWVRHPPDAGFPWQYKFEQRGVAKSKIVGILPIVRYYA